MMPKSAKHLFQPSSSRHMTGDEVLFLCVFDGFKNRQSMPAVIIGVNDVPRDR